jgi:adenylate cyclase
MLSLKIITANQRNFVFSVNKPEVAIGRELENDLILEDPRVSRRHAILRLDGEQFLLCDLGSGNGTYVNEQRVSAHTQVPLCEGDVVKMGACSMTVTRGEATRREIVEDGFRQVAAKMPSELLSLSPLTSASDSQDVPALLYRQELEKKGRILQLFYELSSKLGSLFQLEDVYAQVLDILLQVTPASRVFIFRADEQERKFEQVAVRLRRSRGAHESESKPLPISKTIFAKVANERLSILLDDTLQSFTSESIVINQIRSVMAAPIIGQDELLGIVYADRRDNQEAFTTDDLDLLNAVAVQTGIAIKTVLNHARMQKQLQARERLERFLPHPAVEAIMRAPEQIKLGGTRQTVTAMFADVRSFTTLSEESDPEMIVTLLNRYFSRVSEIIFNHHGTLDKYIGDGLLAIFGAPYESEEHAQQAVRAAIETQQAMAGFNEELVRDGLPPIAIGIGINTGQAIVGYIGTERRLDYTAIGDTINTAARLESMAQAGQIVASEHTLAFLTKAVQTRSLGTTRLRGKRANLRIAEVLWAECGEPA